MNARRAAPWLITLWLALLAVPAHAAAWRVDRGASSIALAATCGHEPCRGVFRTFRADIVYAATDLVEAKLDIQMDVRSLALDAPGSAGAEAWLAALDGARFPHAYLVTTRFRRAPGGQVVAESVLKLRGAIVPVALDVRFTPTGRDTATLDFSTRFLPSDFGIGAGDAADPVRATPVALRGHLELRRRESGPS